MESNTNPGHKKKKKDRGNNSPRAMLMMASSMLIFGTIGVFRRYIPLSSSLLAFFRTGHTSLRLWISVALASAGLYFLSISGGMKFESGDAALVACAFVFSLHIMCIDSFPDVDGVLLSFLQFLVAGILSFGAALAVETISWPAVRAGWFPIVYAGVFSCGIAYTFQIIGQKGADPAAASLILSLESVVSVLAGFLLLGQKLTSRELFGCVLMFIAIVLVQLPVSGSAFRSGEREKTL